MPISINGDALLITLPAANPTFDVQADFYSEWKKWSLLGDNLRYEEAFLPSEGGIPTQPGETLGPGFFFNNDVGWRMRPAEEDASLVIGVNLFRTNVTLPIFVPTLGNFSVFTEFKFTNLSLVSVVEKTGEPQRGVAMANLGFRLVLSSNHTSVALGKSPVVEIQHDDGTWNVSTNSAVESGRGFYRIDLTAAEMDAAIVNLSFTAVDCDDAGLTILTAQ